MKQRTGCGSQGARDASLYRRRNDRALIAQFVARCLRDPHRGSSRRRYAVRQPRRPVGSSRPFCTRSHLRWATEPHELRAPDLVILPGSKATIPDLRWLHERGIAERIRWLAAHGTPVLGICGGLQMLGSDVRDPDHGESEHVHARGLQLLPIETELSGPPSPSSKREPWNDRRRDRLPYANACRRGH